MTYQLSNTGASIEFASGSLKKLVGKHSVTEVSVVRDNMIKIATTDPLKSIYLNHANVDVPSTPAPLDLRNMINAWITDCVCCDCDEGGGID